MDRSPHVTLGYFLLVCFSVSFAAISSLGADPPSGEEAGKAALAKAEADWNKFVIYHPLGMDAKLRVRLSVVANHPKLSDLLEQLRGATGVKLSLADNLERHDPDLGELVLRNTAAYSFLEIIATHDLDNGRWVKMDRGYRLEGVSKKLRPIPAGVFPWGWAAGGAVVVAIAGAACVVSRRCKPKSRTSDPSPQAGEGKEARPAFTLMELLVVLAILGILMALLIPAVQSVRAAAARAECGNKMRQIALACHAFHDDHKRMPPAFGFFPKANIYDGRNGLGNLFYHLLPYVEQQGLYEKSEYQGSGGESQGSGKKQHYFYYMANNVHQQRVPLFNCPSDPTLMPGVNPKTNYAPSSYAANYLVFGVVDAKFVNRRAQGRPIMPASFPDGTSNTILFAEKYASAWLDAKTGTDPGNAGGQSPFSRVGGCHWAYFQADCQNPFFAYYDPIPKDKPLTDPGAVGSGQGTGVGSQGSGISFQVLTNPRGGTNPCLPATGHNAMNAAMADGSVRSLAAGMERRIWWALVTPAGRDRTE